MKLPLSAALLWLVAIAGACEPAYVGTTAPEDAKFSLVCAGGCGLAGREAGLIVDVTFLGSYSRQIAVCCPQRADLRAQLQTVKDLFCDGLEVPDKKIGDITVGTTISQATGKRGATLDQGSGYVAFNCGDWLDKLLVELEKTSCCQPRRPAD